MRIETYSKFTSTEMITKHKQWMRDENMQRERAGKKREGREKE